MPIRPENRDRYPKCWDEIREAVRARAGDHCEWCGKPNRTTVFVDGEGVWYPADPGCGACRQVEVVCTTAHLDHQPEHNDEFEETGKVLPASRSNLAFLCQRCHNRYDAPHRLSTRRATKLRKTGQRTLF